jgi:hypothetical protein
MTTQPKHTNGRKNKTYYPTTKTDTHKTTLLLLNLPQGRRRRRPGHHPPSTPSRGNQNYCYYYNVTHKHQHLRKDPAAKRLSHHPHSNLLAKNNPENPNPKRFTGKRERSGKGLEVLVATVSTLPAKPPKPRIKARLQ